MISSGCSFPQEPISNRRIIGWLQRFAWALHSLSILQSTWNAVSLNPIRSDSINRGREKQKEEITLKMLMCRASDTVMKKKDLRLTCIVQKVPFVRRTKYSRKLKDWDVRSMLWYKLRMACWLGVLTDIFESSWGGKSNTVAFRATDCKFLYRTWPHRFGLGRIAAAHSGCATVTLDGNTSSFLRLTLSSWSTGPSCSDVPVLALGFPLQCMAQTTKPLERSRYLTMHFAAARLRTPVVILLTTNRAYHMASHNWQIRDMG